MPLDFLHGTQTLDHILVTLFLERFFENRVVGEEEIEGFCLFHRLKPRHRRCPFLRFEQ